jgi:hypothetical protein
VRCEPTENRVYIRSNKAFHSTVNSSLSLSDRITRTAIVSRHTMEVDLIFLISLLTVLPSCYHGKCFRRVLSLACMHAHIRGKLMPRSFGSFVLNKICELGYGFNLNSSCLLILILQVPESNMNHETSSSLRPCSFSKPAWQTPRFGQKFFCADKLYANYQCISK